MGEPFVSGDIRAGVASIFRTLLLILGLAVLTAGSPALGQEKPPAGATFEERHEALAKRTDLQFEFTPLPKVEFRPQPQRSWTDNLFDGLQPFLEAIFWGALVLGGLALL